MTLVTQDGRTLELKENNNPEFEAGTYVGHFNAYYVAAKFHMPRKEYRKNRVLLGEYKTLDEARAAKAELETAFKNGKQAFFMRGNKGIIAPKDDLMASIKAAEGIMSGNPLGYWFDFGMIKGLSNGVCDLNPDSDGSYAEAIGRLKANHTATMPEAKSA